MTARIVVVVAVLAGMAAPAYAVERCGGNVDVDCEKPGSGAICEVWVDPNPSVSSGICVLQHN